MKPVFLAIEIGGTKLQIVASAQPPVIDDRFRTPIEPKAGADGILQSLYKGLASLLKDRQALAVGIGFGGPVDRQRALVACSHHVPGWDGFPLGDWVQERCGAPVAMDNDANVAGLAEALHGAGKASNPVFYTTLGSGVGGGLIQNGSIYHGAHPSESEIGHLRLDRSGHILEHSCSGWAVNRKVREAVERLPNSLLAARVQETKGPEALALGPALKDGDALAREILDSTADDLAYGLSHVIHLQHPETIVIGGGLSLLGEPLRRAVHDALPRYMMEIMLPPPQVRLAELGEDVVPVGALALAEQIWLKATQRQGISVSNDS